MFLSLHSIIKGYEKLINKQKTMETKHWKHVGVAALTIAGIFISLWAFNNNVIHPWLALIVCGLIVVLSVSYIINQIKNKN